MQNQTRGLYRQYLSDLSAMYGVDTVTEVFSVNPSMEQTLEKKIQQSSSFLSAINVAGVTLQEGERIGLGVKSPVARRTNTKLNPRKPRRVHDTEGVKYRCVQTDFDTSIGYAELDAWAAFPNFQQLITDSITNQIALDRIMVGFNGVSISDQTDPDAYPLLQDLNKGWLQFIRDNAPERVMDGGKVTGKITIGKDGDYKSLDSLVMDAAHSGLDVWHRQATDIVAIVGGNLMHDKLFPLVNNQTAPTEKLAADIIVSQARLGNRQAVAAPFMLEHGILITSLKNISLYWQKQARRRMFKEAPEWNEVQTFESSNDGYVLEDLGKCVLIENIELLPEAAP